MPEIKLNQLNGKIKELYEKYNLSFFITDNPEIADFYIKQIKENVSNSIALDIETSGLEFWKDDLLGIGIGINLKKAIYINTRNWDYDTIKELIKKINALSNKKVFHNAFFDRKFLLGKFGEDIYCHIDTYTLAHTLNTDMRLHDESLGLKNLAYKFTPFGDYEEELMQYKKEYARKHKIKLANFSYDKIPDEILAPYCAMDTITTLYLYNLFERQIRELEPTWKKIRQVIDIKHKANDIYIKASVRGIQINRKKIKEIHEELNKQKNELISKIFSDENVKEAERLIKRRELKKKQDKLKNRMPLSKCRKIWKETEFNIMSNQHKTVLFYEVLKLPVIKKTDKKLPAADVEVIQHYANKGVKIMEYIDELNKINKVLTAFLNYKEKKEKPNEKGLWFLTSDEHPRIHPNYDINGTVSSRISTKDPNVAQYGSRGLAKIVKKCVEVEEGYKWIAFDFKSFEVAILGFIANEPNIKSMIMNAYDPHSFTALNVFGDKMKLESDNIEDKLSEIKEKYGSTYRYYSKAINFALPYDTTASGLAKQINASRKEAQAMIDAYRNSNKAVANFMDSNKKEAFEKGYVENYYGARLFYRLTKNYNPFSKTGKKDYAALKEYRTTTNFKIQSFNSFYLYERLYTFFNEVEERGLDISLLFTVYDSVQLRVKEDIPDDLVVDLLVKHFESYQDGIVFGIDVTRTPEGKRDWYSYEEVELYSTDARKYKGGD